MAIFNILFPIIFVVSMGYLFAHRQWLPLTSLQGFRTFIFNWAIPTLLFVKMAQADLSQVAPWQLMSSFYGPVIIVYGLILLICLMLKQSLASSASFALGGTYSNTVIVGLPILLSALGESAAALVFVIITFHSAILFALTYLFCSDQKRHFLSILKTLIANPIVMGITFGLLINSTGISLPISVINALEMFASPAIAGSLFLLGTSLVQYGIQAHWRSALALSCVKLMVLPSGVYLVASGFELNSIYLTVLTILSASPLGVNAYLVAREVKKGHEVIASSVALSTLLSCFTLSFWLYILT